MTPHELGESIRAIVRRVMASDLPEDQALKQWTRERFRQDLARVAAADAEAREAEERRLAAEEKARADEAARVAAAHAKADEVEELCAEWVRIVTQAGEVAEKMQTLCADTAQHERLRGNDVAFYVQRIGGLGHWMDGLLGTAGTVLYEALPPAMPIPTAPARRPKLDRDSFPASQRRAFLEMVTPPLPDAVK